MDTMLGHRLQRLSSIVDKLLMACCSWSPLNPLIVKLFNLNFHPPEVVSR